jgi:hypothetical protein
VVRRNPATTLTVAGWNADSLKSKGVRGLLTRCRGLPSVVAYQVSWAPSLALKAPVVSL